MRQGYSDRSIYEVGGGGLNLAVYKVWSNVIECFRNTNSTVRLNAISHVLDSQLVDDRVETLLTAIESHTNFGNFNLADGGVIAAIPCYEWTYQIPEGGREYVLINNLNKVVGSTFLESKWVGNTPVKSEGLDFADPVIHGHEYPETLTTNIGVMVIKATSSLVGTNVKTMLRKDMAGAYL